MQKLSKYATEYIRLYCQCEPNLQVFNLDVLSIFNQG